MTKSEELNENQQAFEEAFAQGDVDAAIAAFSRLEQAEPKAVFTRVAKARLEAAHGNIPAAVMTLRHTVSANPKSGYARGYYGSLLVADGKFIKAVAQLTTAFDDGCDSAAARHSLGVALLETGKPAAAIEHLQAAVAILEQPSSYFFLGQCFEHARDFAQAEEAYELCCDMMPGYEGAIACLARSQALQGKFKEAKATIEAGLKLQPEDLELMRFLVQVNLDLGDHDAARAALQSMPSDAKTAEDLVNEAGLALEDERWDDALALADQAEDKDPKHWRPPYVRGIALERSEAARQEICAAYEQAIVAGDPYGEAGTRLGYVLLTADNANGARAVLEEAVERNGGAPGTLLNLALACVRAGDPVRAQALANQVAEHPHARDGDREEAKRLLQNLAV